MNGQASVHLTTGDRILEKFSTILLPVKARKGHWLKHEAISFNPYAAEKECRSNALPCTVAQISLYRWRVNCPLSLSRSFSESHFQEVRWCRHRKQMATIVSGHCSIVRGLEVPPNAAKWLFLLLRLHSMFWWLFLLCTCWLLRTSLFAIIRAYTCPLSSLIQQLERLDNVLCFEQRRQQLL